MIKASFVKADRYFTVHVKGHALAGKKGNDLVCCAVSTLVQSWTLSTDKVLHQPLLVLKNQSGIFYAQQLRSRKSEILFDSLYVSLLNLGNQYPNYLKVHLEEKNGT